MNSIRVPRIFQMRPSKQPRLQSSCVQGGRDSPGASDGLTLISAEEKGYALHPCKLHRRYKRFLGDVSFGNDETVVIHVPNTGPMTGLLDHLPSRALVSESSNPKRKYKHTLEWMMDGDGTWVGVHSAKANAMVAQLLDAQVLKDILPIPYTRYNREVSIAMKKLHSGGDEKGNKKKKNEYSSRIDFELIDDVSGRTCLVEVKSVTMMVEDEQHGRVAVFPDTKSERAQRHVKELTDVVKGKTADAALIFLIQRGDCASFSPCFEKDPEYAALVSEAVEAGVTIVPVVVDLESDKDIPKRVKYSGLVPFIPFKERSGL